MINRLKEISQELDVTGTYTPTAKELEFGARTAWRNASRVSIVSCYFCSINDMSQFNIIYLHFHIEKVWKL